MMRYPSDIVDQVLLLGPDPDMLSWSSGDTHCSHCSRPINAGDLYQPAKVGAFFSDTRNLLPTHVICWRCVTLRKKPLLYGLSAAVITMEGIFPIAKDVHKAWLFTTPPPAPFLAVHSSSTMQHLSWRTPVTVDNKLIRLRYGPTLYSIRPSAMREALAIGDRYNLSLTESVDPKKKAKIKWLSPLHFDRKAQSSYHGQLRKEAEDHLSDQDVRFLTSLTPGEKWGLSFLMHSKKPEPETPEPITSKVLSKLN